MTASPSKEYHTLCFPSFFPAFTPISCSCSLFSLLARGQVGLGPRWGIAVSFNKQLISSAHAAENDLHRHLHYKKCLFFWIRIDSINETIFTTGQWHRGLKHKNTQQKCSGMGRVKRTIVWWKKNIVLHVLYSIYSSQHSAFAFFAVELSVITQQWSLLTAFPVMGQFLISRSESPWQRWKQGDIWFHVAVSEKLPSSDFSLCQSNPSLNYAQVVWW